MEHCKNQNLKCINLAKEIDLNYEDFYDYDGYVKGS